MRRTKKNMKKRKQYTKKNQRKRNIFILKGGTKGIPPLQVNTIGSPHKLAFHHMQNLSEAQNNINNGNHDKQLGGSNESLLVPQLHTGMAPTPMDANAQSIHSASSLLQTNANSACDSCLESSTCPTGCQTGGTKKLYKKKNKSRKRNKRKKRKRKEKK